MAISEQKQNEFVAPYTRPRFGSQDDQQAWLDKVAKRRQSQRYTHGVAPRCSVGTRRDTLLKDGEQVTPADVGGAANLSELVRAGVVIEIDERQAATNRGDFEFVTLKSVTHKDGVLDAGQGFNAEELDVPAEPPYETFDADTRRIVKRQGRPAVDGAAKAEEWIKRGIAERARLRERVVKSVKSRLKAKAASKPGA